jgi:hypothetical protein
MRRTPFSVFSRPAPPLIDYCAANAAILAPLSPYSAGGEPDGQPRSIGSAGVNKTQNPLYCRLCANTPFAPLPDLRTSPSIAAAWYQPE